MMSISQSALILSFRLCLTLSKQQSDVGLNGIQLIERYGYPCENHEITTEDGYILNYQRIPHGLTNSGSNKKPPVLVTHGIFATSEEFIDMGPKYGLGYILSDLGYDVWLANGRGNSWSRKHKTLNITSDKKKFYDFSWHEIGYYDLPAAIDHILNVTKLHSLYYIGHSQGGTAFLVLASMRPEYAKKIKLALLIVPASFMVNFQQKGFVQNIYKYEKMCKRNKIYEVPLVETFQKLVSTLCAMRQYFTLCRAGYFLAGGNVLTPEVLERLPVLASHFPSHISIKQIFHFGQLARNGGFRQYDHGVKKNRRIYGQEFPPSYNLSKIATPVAVFYTKGDSIVNYKDTQTLIKLLPNVVYEYLGPPSLGHTDYVFTKDIIDPVIGKLIKVLKSY